MCMHCTIKVTHGHKYDTYYIIDCLHNKYKLFCCMKVLYVVFYWLNSYLIYSIVLTLLSNLTQLL